MAIHRRKSRHRKRKHPRQEFIEFPHVDGAAGRVPGFGELQTVGEEPAATAGQDERGRARFLFGIGDVLSFNVIQSL